MKVKSGKINEFAFEKRQIAKRIKNISEGLGYKFDHDFAAYLGLNRPQIIKRYDDLCPYHETSGTQKFGVIR
jgi:hypothetical protein